MNDASIEFNKQLELDVMISGLSEVTDSYVCKFDRDELTEVVIPDGVKSIGDWAFADCRRLTKVTIGNDVTSIGTRAFYMCNSLTSVTIGKGVTSIGYGGFSYCKGLKSVMIPDSVRYISETAFWFCQNHLSLTFEDRTLSEVCSMQGYPWNISPEKIHVQVS